MLHLDFVQYEGLKKHQSKPGSYIPATRTQFKIYKEEANILEQTLKGIILHVIKLSLIDVESNKGY